MTQKFQNADNLVGTYYQLVSPYKDAALKGAISLDFAPIWEAQGRGKMKKFVRADYF